MNRLDLIETYDMYESLLTDKEKEIFKLYYEEDLSLSEISENLHISRSAISKTLKTGENKLMSFEEKIKKLTLKQELKNILKEEDVKEIKKRITEIIEE